MTPSTLVALAAALAGCQPEASPRAAPPAAGPPPARFAVRFVDVAAEVGLDALHVNGFSEARFFPETMGGGGLLWDYDRDGWLDVYLVNGRPLSPDADADAPPVGNRLFRGLGDGTFAEATSAAGVGHRGYGNGCVAGDLDGDGDDELYVTNYGGDMLFRNDAGAFRDVTSAAGLGDPGWGTGCAVLDHDLDGDLDLYVARYVDYELADAGTATVPYLSRSEGAGPGGPKGYPHPDNFDGLGDLLLRNDGGPGPAFTDVSAAAGVHLAGGKGLGVVTGDVDGDGWTDLYVANDATPNFLFINRRDGTFEERGALSGVAYGESGLPEAGMGVDAADYDGDGRLDLTVTNFQGEPNSLFRNQGDGSYFLPQAYASGTGAVTVPALAFGTNWVDVDGDGRLDLFAANGHVLDNVRAFDRSTTYRQRNFLFHNRGPGAYGNTLFADVTAIAGPGLAQERVSRGSAAGDLDNDGDADLLVINLGDRVSVLRNEGGNGNGWLSVRLRRASSGSGEGARLRLHSPSGTQSREVSSGRSYLSQSDPRVLFGLGPDSRVDSLEIWWPGGAREVYRDLEAGRFLDLVEGGAR